MIVRRPKTGKIVCHRDGSATFFCIFHQMWVRQFRISDEQHLSLNVRERVRIARHFENHGGSK